MLLAGQKLELFDADTLPQLLQGQKLNLPHALLAEVQVPAYLLQRLLFFSDQRTQQAEVIDDDVLLPLVKIVPYDLQKTVMGAFDGSDINGWLGP